MKSIEHSNSILRPLVGDNHLKIFLSNLDGRINTEDLHKFFNPFGKIEHIESWTPKSALVLFSNIDSIDRVLSKHRKCVINNQEIYIRRFRYGYIDRAYMDSNVLFIRLLTKDLSLAWNEITIRNYFHEYEMKIEQIRVVSKSLHAFIHFTDYDIVDRILVQADMFKSMDMKRAKCKENEMNVEKLIEKNKLLKKEIERQRVDSHHEIKHLKRKINKLKSELIDFKYRYYYN